MPKAVPEVRGDAFADLCHGNNGAETVIATRSRKDMRNGSAAMHRFSTTCNCKWKTILHRSRSLMTRTLFIASAALLAGLAFAHPDAHHASASFAAGLSHPIAGWDHLLAMLAVGICAAQQKRALNLLMPLAFPLMGLGAIVAMHFGDLHSMSNRVLRFQSRCSGC